MLDQLTLKEEASQLRCHKRKFLVALEVHSHHLLACASVMTDIAGSLHQTRSVPLWSEEVP